MTHPTSVRDALQQARQHFPGATVLFATDGTREIGNSAWDDPQQVGVDQGDSVADRAKGEALQAMRAAVGIKARGPL